MHTYRFDLDSTPDVSILIEATCYRKAIHQFCLIFGDTLSTSHVSRIVKLN